MKILFIGDVMSSIGRDMVEDYLYRIKQQYQIDFVIANVENASHGKGLLKKHYEFFVFQGVQAMTMGNHTFDKKEIFDYIDEANRLIVPMNQPRALPGTKSRVFDCLGKKIRITSVLGSAFMDTRNGSPFEMIDDYLDLEHDIHIIDYHGEATSEKVVFAHYVKDKVQAVLGTHTHVQTADEKIIDGKCAFISDVGMTGPYRSAIGCDIDSVITRMKGFHAPFIIAESSGQLCAVVLTFEDNKVVDIERIMINEDHSF
ncbi:TIGR00282 family metallophosphoesterase [Tannockella kyphosi]|uniref:TIGR00282 family metallophosphoesterase n=1 Tax=Tannockella kyphosi TaxID=2899121 RepID=UPI002011CCC0|nr:TIGR00282 family metallophosphoesterase [Tannockella kyphosi]